MIASSRGPEIADLLERLGAPKHTRKFVLRAEVDSIVEAEIEYYPDDLSALAESPLLAHYRLVAFDDADLRAKFEKILSPAIDCAAPYARVMLDALVKAVVG